mmetsp:Transcript_30391/g.33947  ORF Transcript_30391/g.33947 Transcript_30391/m.33947 type:complete len:314 (-) Transcript_30391:63-1004(-)
MPYVNYTIYKYLVDFMVKIVEYADVNFMNINNLIKCIIPTIRCSPACFYFPATNYKFFFEDNKNQPTNDSVAQNADSQFGFSMFGADGKPSPHFLEMMAQEEEMYAAQQKKEAEESRKKKDISVSHSSSTEDLVSAGERLANEAANKPKKKDASKEEDEEGAKKDKSTKKTPEKASDGDDKPAPMIRNISWVAKNKRRASMQVSLKKIEKSNHKGTKKRSGSGKRRDSRGDKPKKKGKKISVSDPSPSVTGSHRPKTSVFLDRKRDFGHSHHHTDHSASPRSFKMTQGTGHSKDNNNTTVKEPITDVNGSKQK